MLPWKPARSKNVAAGVVSATSTDAINGSQLYHTNQAILNGVNGNLANLGARIGQVEDAANAGTAAAMAMAGLPQAYLPGKSMNGCRWQCLSR